MTTFGDMVYHSGGVPVQSGGLPIIVGNVYFVSSVKGSSSNDGTLDRPYNTLERAMDFTTDNDCVILMPGHAETLSATGQFELDSSGLTVWGVGHYDNRPTFTYSAVTAFAEVTAPNVRLHNVRFLAGIKVVNKAMHIDAKGFMMTNCHFEEVVGSSYNFDFAIEMSSTANACDGLHIEGCEFYQDANLSTGGIAMTINNDDVTIRGNKFIGKWTTNSGPINLSSTVALYGLEISNNWIINAQATATRLGITVLADSGYGIIANNYMMSPSTVADKSGFINVSATGTIGCFENYVTGEIEESGVLAPAAYSTA